MLLLVAFCILNVNAQNEHPDHQHHGHGHGHGHQRATTVNICLRNEMRQNLKLRCQSKLADLNDQWLANNEEFCFKFEYFEIGNQYFWCDTYGLNDFATTFDIFGGSAPLAKRKTWRLRPDGLYMDENEEPIQEWNK